MFFTLFQLACWDLKHFLHDRISELSDHIAVAFRIQGKYAYSAGMLHHFPVYYLTVDEPGFIEPDVNYDTFVLVFAGNRLLNTLHIKPALHNSVEIIIS